MKILLSEPIVSTQGLHKYLGKDVWVLANIIDWNNRIHSFYIKLLAITGDTVTYNYVSLWFMKHIYLGHRFDVTDYDRVSKTVAFNSIDEITLYTPIEIITDAEMQNILSYQDTYQPPISGEVYE